MSNSLIAIAPDLWVATQPLRFLGLEVGSRMTVIRLPHQELILISPIELNSQLCQALNELGAVRHIIAPNCFHHLSLAAAQTNYPDAKIWGVANLPAKRPDIDFGGLLTEAGNFADVLNYLPFEGLATILPRGIQLLNEVVFWHRPSRTLIVTDIAFKFDQSSALLTQIAAQILGTAQVLSPSRLEKWGTRDKKRVEASVRQVLKWDFDRAIPGHGSIVETDGKAQFQAGYEWFLARSLDPLN